jgi:hypothetical protein
LNVTGNSPALFNSITATGNLTAAGITGTTLNTTGDASIGGKLTAANVTTGGALTAANANVSGTLSAANLSLSGTFSAANLSTTGALTAGSLTVPGTVNLNGAKITGTVDFSGATVTGLSGTGLGSGTVANLVVGSTTAVNPPLTITENGTNTSLGVDQNGNLVLAHGITVNGPLAITGSTGFVTSALTAPNVSGGTTPGALSLTGNPINLAGTTALTNGSDLTITNTNASGTATHLIANGDKDLAGTASVTLPASATLAANTDLPVSVNFTKAFTTAPVVTITPAANPTQGGASPYYWVTLISSTTNNVTTYTGFTIHYISTTAITAPSGGLNIPFNYHVVGS